MARYTDSLNACLNAPCPFYKADHKRTISCANDLAEDDVESQITLTFESNEKKTEYVSNFCMYYPNGCRFAKLFEEDSTGI